MSPLAYTMCQTVAFVCHDDAAAAPTLPGSMAPAVGAVATWATGKATAKAVTTPMERLKRRRCIEFTSPVLRLSRLAERDRTLTVTQSTIRCVDMHDCHPAIGQIHPDGP